MKGRPYRQAVQGLPGCAHLTELGSCQGGRGCEQVRLAQQLGKQTSWPGLAECWRQEWAPGPLACSYLLCAGVAKRFCPQNWGVSQEQGKETEPQSGWVLDFKKDPVAQPPQVEGRMKEAGGR